MGTEIGVRKGRSDKRFEALLLASASIVWWTNASGEFVDEQPYWQAYTGQTWEEYRGSRWMSCLHADDRDAIIADWNRAVTSGAPYYTQGRIWSAKHNAYRAFQTRGIAIRDENGAIEEWLGALTDVQDTIDLRVLLERTQDELAQSLKSLRVSEAEKETHITELQAEISARNRAEAALRESEKRLRLALDGADLGSWDVDLKTGKTVWNRHHAEMQGYDPDAVPASIERWCERIHPDDKERVEASFQKAAREHGLFAIEHRYVRADTGEVIWTSLYGRFTYDEDGQPIRVSGVSLDVTEHKRAEERLEAISDELRQTLDITPTGITRCSRDLRYVSANRAYAVLVGKPIAEIVGRPIIEVLGESAFTAIHPYVERVLAGETVEYEGEVQYNGETRLVNVVCVPDRDEHGHICGWVASVHDVTARRRSEERLQLVMGEVNHRAKNMLSLVQAVARQTAASAPEVFITRFSERIQALSAAQDLLVKNDWTGVGLDELIRSQLAHFKDVIGSRISLRGPLITVTASAAQTLGMAFHELATNAGKYGALSTEKGRVDIAWDFERLERAEPRFVISWRESDGPPVEKPSCRGFGSTAIDAMTRMSLSCEPRIEFNRSGFTWRIECPAESIVANAKLATTTRCAKSVDAARPGPASVLVVEDEALLALEIATVLSDGGFDVIGPAATVAHALKLLALHHCDAAVLDINLGQETAEPIARRLAAADIPFITVSGYSRDQQPAVFSHAPFLSKPFDYQRLLEELKRL